jgi:hypothetical protein
MNATQPSRTATPSLGRDLLAAARYHLGGRRGLLLLGAVAVAGGLASSWGWLVAAGVAPLLLSVLPCAAMCALGLCMNRMGRASGAAETGAANSAASTLASTADPSQLALDLDGPDRMAAPHSADCHPSTGKSSCCTTN